jgi:cytochrome c5
MRNLRVSLRLTLPLFFLAIANISCADNQGTDATDSALQVHEAEMRLAANDTTAPSASGEELYTANCSACHQVKAPSRL